MNKRCAIRGHKFKQLEVPLPYIFCSRWGCEASAVSNFADPRVAVDLHNAIPKEQRFPRVTLAPDGTVLEEF
jgi:hypothetical protein